MLGDGSLDDGCAVEVEWLVGNGRNGGWRVGLVHPTDVTAGNVGKAAFVELSDVTRRFPVTNCRRLREEHETGRFRHSHTKRPEARGGDRCAGNGRRRLRRCG